MREVWLVTCSRGGDEDEIFAIFDSLNSGMGPMLSEIKNIYGDSVKIEVQHYSHPIFILWRIVDTDDSYTFSAIRLNQMPTWGWTDELL